MILQLPTGTIVQCGHFVERDGHLYGGHGHQAVKMLTKYLMY